MSSLWFFGGAFVLLAFLILFVRARTPKRITKKGERRCGVCHKRGVKLYRPYSEFLRAERIRCLEHIPEGEENWYVPLIEDDDGSVWGYICPTKDIDEWHRLPE